MKVTYLGPFRNGGACFYKGHTFSPEASTVEIDSSELHKFEGNPKFEVTNGNRGKRRKKSLPPPGADPIGGGADSGGSE